MQYLLQLTKSKKQKLNQHPSKHPQNMYIGTIHNETHYGTLGQYGEIQ